MKKIFGYLFCLSFILSSCQSDSTNSENTATSEADEAVYTKVDVMPRFSGCEDLAKDKRTACASSKMFGYLRENIKYPEVAKSEGIEGRAVVSFVVDKSGKIRDVEVVQDPGNGMGEEAQRIVQSFPDWVPGLLKGEKVNVKYLIPVRFKL